MKTQNDNFLNNEIFQLWCGTPLITVRERDLYYFKASLIYLMKDSWGYVERPCHNNNTISNKIMIITRIIIMCMFYFFRFEPREVKFFA